MVKRHLKSLNAPKAWTIKRKENKWITRPNPGTHKLEESMPISLVLRLLKLTKTAKEAQQTINQRHVLVNKKPVRDKKFSVGLFDVIELSNAGIYRVLYDKRGKLILVKISKEESSKLPLKIVNKILVKGKLIQLNFNNGFNLLTKETKYNTNDVLIFEEGKVKDHIPFDKGSLVYILKGKHLGELAKIDAVHKEPPLNNQVSLEIKSKKINLPKNNVFAVGKTQPLITITQK